MQRKRGGTEVTRGSRSYWRKHGDAGRGPATAWAPEEEFRTGSFGPGCEAQGALVWRDPRKETLCAHASCQGGRSSWPPARPERGFPGRRSGKRCAGTAWGTGRDQAAQVLGRVLGSRCSGPVTGAGTPRKVPAGDRALGALWAPSCSKSVPKVWPRLGGGTAHSRPLSLGGRGAMGVATSHPTCRWFQCCF